MKGRSDSLSDDEKREKMSFQYIHTGEGTKITDPKGTLLEDYLEQKKNSEKAERNKFILVIRPVH